MKKGGEGEIEEEVEENLEEEEKEEDFRTIHEKYEKVIEEVM